MTNIQSKSQIPFCKFIDKSVIHVSRVYPISEHFLPNVPSAGGDNIIGEES